MPTARRSTPTIITATSRWSNAMASAPLRPPRALRTSSTRRCSRRRGAVGPRPEQAPPPAQPPHQPIRIPSPAPLPPLGKLVPPAQGRAKVGRGPLKVETGKGGGNMGTGQEGNSAGHSQERANANTPRSGAAARAKWKAIADGIRHDG